jgi:hypothetical protein
VVAFPALSPPPSRVVPDPTHFPSHGRKLVTRWACAATIAWAFGCDANEGVPPPPDAMFFPSGLLLDPRTPEDEPARYLFIASGNNDLSYNGGSIIAVDLERFFAAWADDDGGVYPYCEKNDAGEIIGRCVVDATYETSAERPCRRLAVNTQVAECDERWFTVDSVRIGDFATVMAASHEPDGRARVWVPVRSEPSIMYVDLDERDHTRRPNFLCGDPEPAGDGLKRCADRHKLSNLRNDESLTALGREPFTMMVSDEHRLAYVAHSEGGSLTLIALDGILRDGDGPAIVDIPSPRPFAAPNARSGGWGLAQRPCFAAGEGPLGAADPEPNIPSGTLGCERPLMYATWRYVARLSTFTASPLDLDRLPPGARTRTSCFNREGEFMGQYCAGPEDIGEPCAVICDPQIRNTRSISIPVSDPVGVGARSLLGDMFFADERGDELFVLQTNPGALLKFNTSLDNAGDPLDVPAGGPIEICEEPTRMVKFEDEGQRFALITCFRSAYIFVVDLDMHRVVDSIVAGTGPHDLVVDPVRGFLYAANTLESSVSVVDLRRTSRTRFTEVARIGLQEPYSR